MSALKRFCESHLDDFGVYVELDDEPTEITFQKPDLSLLAPATQLRIHWLKRHYGPPQQPPQSLEEALYRAELAEMANEASQLAR